MNRILFHLPTKKGHIGVYSFSFHHGKEGYISEDKHVEGDMKTPLGIFHPLQVFYRPDRLTPPQTKMPLWALSPQDGWCDDPHSPEYNRAVHLPSPYGHEKMWLDTSLYDLGIVIDHNTSPPIPGKGSAIFIHIASPKGYTAGCLGLQEKDLRQLCKALTPETELVFGE